MVFVFALRFVFTLVFRFVFFLGVVIGTADFLTGGRGRRLLGMEADGQTQEASGYE
jgi:hypothetical protein